MYTSVSCRKSVRRQQTASSTGGQGDGGHGEIFWCCRSEKEGWWNRNRRVLVLYHWGDDETRGEWLIDVGTRGGLGAVRLLASLRYFKAWISV